VVAVTGNSMGWYSALACAGALSPMDGFTVVNTMGTLMQEALIGGQTVYPFMGEDWQDAPARHAELLALVAEIGASPGHDLGLSIDLGGMLVLAGNEAGLKAFEAAVPPVQGRFPMRLGNHAAFHTALQAPVAAKGRAALPEALFTNPPNP
jgi:[acyl-carrier-protein] S-malonyltransferase